MHFWLEFNVFYVCSDSRETIHVTNWATVKHMSNNMHTVQTYQPA